MTFDEEKLKATEIAAAAGVDADKQAEYLLFSQGKAQSCTVITELVAAGKVIDIYLPSSADPSRKAGEARFKTTSAITLSQLITKSK